MAKLVIFGATGYAGGHLCEEALARGHDVVAVARDVGAIAEQPGLTAHAGSLGDAAFVADVSAGADVLVSALPGRTLTAVLPVLLDAARRGGARVGLVGGAGSLRVAPDGPLLMDTPQFPDRARGEAAAQAEVLSALRDAPVDLDWFYLSPAATFGAFAPGERRGTYRTGGDVLVTDADGGSTIGGADYALAFVDEIEEPLHRNVRFTVGY